MVHARLELNEREQLAGALFDSLARPSAQVQREADVFERRQRRQQVEELEDESDLVAAHPRQVVVGEAGERLAVDAHTAGGRTVESADEIEERRLARSGGSDDRDHLAARDRDAHIVEGGDAALAGELLGDVLERDHVRRGDAHAKLCEHFHKAVKLTRNSADSIVDRPQRDGCTTCVSPEWPRTAAVRRLRCRRIRSSRRRPRRRSPEQSGAPCCNRASAAAPPHFS